MDGYACCPAKNIWLSVFITPVRIPTYLYYIHITLPLPLPLLDSLGGVNGRQEQIEIEVEHTVELEHD